MERLAQSETYYPGYQEPDSGVTGVAFGICRLTDGFWYDFNDSTFKDSGWTTKHQALAEDDDGFWLYTTGWAIPDANATHQVQWKVTDASGTFYAEGPKIVVNSALLDAIAVINAKTINLPSGIAKNVALPKFSFYMVLSSDHVSPATGKTVTVQISKDDGDFANITNAVSEVGSGKYAVASGLTQAEMNADVIDLKMTADGCDQRVIGLYPT